MVPSKRHPLIRGMERAACPLVNLATQSADPIVDHVRCVVGLPVVTAPYLYCKPQPFCLTWIRLASLDGDRSARADRLGRRDGAMRTTQGGISRTTTRPASFMRSRRAALANGDHHARALLR